MNSVRKVISKSTKRKSVPRGSKNLEFMEMVVYKTQIGNGKFISQTRHEVVKQN